MKIYIAARFSKRPQANALARQLASMGHEITSRWVLPDCDHVMPTGLSKQAEDEERARFAKEDIEDLDKAQWCISLMEEPRSNGRGGRHIEFGYALGKGKVLTIIGPKETVFHHLDEVDHFDSVADFLCSMEGVNCKQCQAGFGPSHNGSKSCMSGSIASGGNRAHCTCDTCF